MSASYAIYPSLRGKSVLVTGGASGIGAHIVRGFHAQGAKVTFIDIDATAAADLVASLGGEVRFVEADLMQVGNFDALVAGITAAQGAPQVLVNNAAHDQRHEIGKTTQEDWDWSLSINLRHVFFMAQSVVPGMQAQGGGAIVNLSSITALMGHETLAPYAAAKGAIISLTKTLALKFGADGIRCNTVAPGAVVTPRQAKLWVSPVQHDALKQRQCLHEPVREDDIANAVLFLSSDEARMITKQLLVVDGGLT